MVNYDSSRKVTRTVQRLRSEETYRYASANAPHPIPEAFGKGDEIVLLLWETRGK
ncbi:hypothetical protein GCM10023187_21120 [Nibrella viscosa]|uniref:Uncharacterized protein n=1 Tax=Nibrella viscosa TaxID=1084524 RepID=A0ABP8KDJ3_9BACT